MIIIVGAGLAGLTCAKVLTQAGRKVLVLEAADQAGGRLRTDYHEDGYRLDRGFQVLFTSYPAVHRHLTIEQLRPRVFDPGAILVKGGKRYEIADPLREPKRIVPGLLNPLLSASDKARVFALRQRLVGASTADIFAGKLQPDGKDETTEAYLRREGFSDKKFIDNFARPFYGGIFLDRTLQTSARMFQFLFKTLATGDTVIPAEGIQRIPDQLVAALPAGTLRCNTRVSALLVSNGRVQGVRLANGEQIKAEQVVVATSSPDALKLMAPFEQRGTGGQWGKPLPTQGMSAVCLYFAGNEQLYRQRKILLNADPYGFVNNAVLLTNIAPTYAPRRKHLLSVTVLGNPMQDDEWIAQQCRVELGGWFPYHSLKHWELLAVYRIPFAQFAQPVGVFDELPDNSTGIDGLYIAGEYTKSSSIQGAMHSGEYAANALLKVPASVAGV
jgi:phytoene dehydrogenase-like protein